ncbi:sushi, von Willebrand factor type A, EGF and pentraxin domain-containing protein 1-like [Mercenaria mercenaria]|uniref:sushi, von Willebrand factor type A, EGF and pentraxin domain-containing protein 1-like n=1 Tax=Mercenaria mercenaria TaxID=6596 RepID=UPI001E1DB5F9|nr:sushi, von Willebrand factor type A, EGF and pentraxin domain-containing protein 1-like [Mercenaria mercenaria]
MDYPYVKSRKDSSPDRLDGTRKSLGATRIDGSNDYGSDWLNGGYNWEASRREEYGMSRRDVPEDWYALRTTLRDDSGNRRRDNLGRTMKENLGATRRVDLGATGDTRHKDFGASAADGLRATNGNLYRDSRYGNPEVPYYRQVLDTRQYGASRSSPNPTHVREETIYHTIEPYDSAVKEGKYLIGSGQETGAGKQRRCTSVADDRDLMQERHAMFGKIRTKWAPSYRPDDPATVSKWSDENSSKDGDPRKRNLRLVIIVAVVAVVVLVAALVPTLLLTLGKDEEKEVLAQYEFKATITNREYSADMAGNNSDAFIKVENEFCDQLDQNAANKRTAEFSYDGCAVKEIKNGSLIIIYIIVIRTSVSRDGTLPTPQEVSTVVGIEVAADNQTVGDLTIVTVEIEITVPTVITENENPVKKKIQFNGVCLVGSNKERCVTKHSECIEGVCKCPVDRTHDSSSDNCTRIDCGDEPVINNGTVTSNGTKYGSTLNITCDEGFELSENATINCTTPGTWGDMPLCTPKECPEFITPNNSEIDSNTTGRTYTDIIEITCITGYELDSSLSTVTCLANQSWSESPVCSVVNCNASDIPVNTIISWDKQKYEYNENVTVECDTGFQLEGNATISCQANGTWEHIPECSPVDCEPLPVPDNAAIYPNKQQYEYNDNITIECNNGYKIQGENTSSCQANGSWTDAATCTPKECDLFVIPENAEFTPNKSQFFYSENVTIKCNIGYELQGNETISCQTDGTWREVPACSPVECERFDVPNKANLEPDKQQYNYSESVTLECESGYEIRGNFTVTCQENASWTEIPTCKPIYCSTLQLPEHAETNSNITGLNFDDEISISCQNGFVLVGESKVSCNANGTWPAISCVPANCSTENITMPENSETTMVNETVSTFEVQCVEGYTIVGNSSVTCIAGNWSEFPSCVIVDCGPYEPSGETYTIESNSTTTYNTSISVTCVDGLELTNDSMKVVSCEADGQWNGHIECKIPGKYITVFKSKFKEIMKI